MVAKTGMEIKLKPFLFVLFLCFVCFSSQVSAECGGEGAEGRCYNKPQATKLKIIAIFAIFVTSMIGVCLPLVSRSVKSLQPDTNLFMLIKAFASGVILATGYMHVLPDSFNDLNSECLPETPWRKFPFTTFVAMVSAIFTLMVDSVSMSWHTKNSLANSGNGESDPTKVGHGHSHPHAHLRVHGDEEEGKKQLLRKRVVAQVLELGIVVHSVVIGLSLGTSMNPCTIRPLVAALCFHQLFEGMGLGGCILQAELSNKVKGWMVFFFALTTPGGIALGMALSNVYSEDSPTALIVVGLLNASSAGLLNYMALVDLLAADFMGPKLLMNMRLQFWAYLCVLLGAGGMSVMALWA